MTSGINGNSLRYNDFTNSFFTKPEVKGGSSSEINIGIGKPSTPDNKNPLKIESSQPSNDNLEARAELDSKVSSTDISYADANKTIEEIRAKYTDDKYFALAPKGTHNPYAAHSKSEPLEKCFDPVKLPEPDRTAYKEAVASKKEIENNNPELVKNSGHAINRINESDAIPLFGNITSNPNEKGWLESFIKNTSITGMSKTEKQKNAIKKLDTLTTSEGITYKDAKAKLVQITEENKNNPDCFRTFTKGKRSWDGFDPYKLPEPGKTEYFAALNAILEIEQHNTALVSLAGITPLGEPEKPLE